MRLIFFIIFNRKKFLSYQKFALEADALKLRFSSKMCRLVDIFALSIMFGSSIEKFSHSSTHE